MDENAPISVTTIPGERYVGMEFDFILEWQLLSDVAIDLQYGIFIPGEAYPDSDPRHFLYAGFSYGF
jgi:hypothetical protein